jgi:hypothetical protein
MLNLNDLRVELLQSGAPHRMMQGGARDLLLFLFNKKQPAAAGFAEFTPSAARSSA